MAKKIIILFALLLGLLVRLYKIDSPIADWHSFRQADTASVTRNFLVKGIDILYPTYHDLSNVQSGKDNPHGYRMVELPIYNATSVVVYRVFKPIFNNLTLEITQRLVSILCSLLSALLLYLIVYEITSSFWPAFLSMFVFLVLPFNIFYSRTILPEPMAVLFMTLSLYLFKKLPIFSAIALALAILIKPYTAIILFPIFFYWTINKFRKSKNFVYQILLIFVYLIIFLTPFVLWRLWIQHFPEGIPVSNWLFNEGGMRFRPAWFRWLFYERIGKLILASFGTIPLFLGFAFKKKDIQICLALLSVGVLGYFSIIARGNIQHDYYQVLIIPIISIIVGVGLWYMYSFLFDNKIISILTTTIVFSFAIIFSWYQIQEYYKINNPVIMEAGEKANEILPKNAKIVAPYTGDTAFLYQTKRSGWPVEIYDINHILSLAKPDPVYFVSVNYDNYTNELINQYPAIYRSDKLIILDLNVTPSPKK